MTPILTSIRSLFRSWRLRRRALGPRSLLGGIPASRRSLKLLDPTTVAASYPCARSPPGTRRVACGERVAAVELRTARLRLRTWRGDDVDLLARLNGDERVMEFMWTGVQTVSYTHLTLPTIYSV